MTDADRDFWRCWIVVAVVAVSLLALSCGGCRFECHFSQRSTETK